MATVLIVPGFGGSKLLSEPGFWRGGQEVWLSLGSGATGGVLALRLNENSLRPYYPFASVLVAGSRIDHYYPPLEDYLSLMGWQVIWAQLDWRLDISRNAPYLADLIARVGSPDPVRIVCHSRGGMVMQAACAALAAAGALDSVRQVVSVCCPYAGSYCPIPFLGGWALSAPDNRGIWAAMGVLDSVPFLASFFRDICTSFPGLYELLPDPATADAHGGTNTAAYYDPTTWSQVGRPVIAAHLTDAAARWASRPAYPAGVRVDCIVGTGIATPGAGGSVPGITGPGDVRAGTGDGTVPDWSATIAGARSTQTFPVGHNDSLRDSGVLMYIDSLLRS